MVFDEKEYRKIKFISNKSRFKIIKLLENSKKDLTITDIKSLLKLGYDKTRKDITLLQRNGFISKLKKGRCVYIKLKIKPIIEFQKT